MIRAQDQDIQSLVADIRDGKLLLPEMQRRYVWKSTQWARNRMAREGLLKADSPRGVWEISDAGRLALAKGIR